MLMDGEKLTREPPKVRMPTREEIEKKMGQKKAKEDKTAVLGPLAGEVKA